MSVLTIGPNNSRSIVLGSSICPTTVNSNLTVNNNLIVNSNICCQFPSFNSLRIGTGNWSQIGADITGSSGDTAGTSCAISSDGTIIAYGSPGYSPSGKVSIYKYINSVWTKLGTDISGISSENAGKSCAISSDGTIVCIGSPNWSTNIGRVRIYKYNGSIWQQLGLDISGNSSESSGYSCALSSDGTIVSIGSYSYSSSNSNTGRVRLYKYNGSTWQQLGLDISGNFVFEYLGYSCALSSDGTIVSIGSSNYSSSISQVGRVRLYKYNGSTWQQLGLDISGNFASENSGYSCALSSDGTIVSIGSPNWTTNIGRVRIYNLLGNTNITSNNFSTVNASFNNVSIASGLSVNGQVNATSFNSTSDYRLKENITYFSNDLNNYNFKNLKPCKYNFKNSSTTKLGFIAHEVQEIIPESVIGEKDGNIQTIDYSALTTVSILELQKLNKRVETLENILKINNL